MRMWAGFSRLEIQASSGLLWMW